MKVTPEHLATIREAVAPLDTTERRARYRAGDFPRADAVQDLDKRYRWDLFWASASHFGAGKPEDAHARALAVNAMLRESDYADAHLDTALRSIVPPLSVA